MRSLVVSLIILFFLFGCSSGVTRLGDAAAQNKIYLSEENPVSSVSVSLTDKAKKKAAKNLKFDPKKLQDYIQRALEANSLVDSASEGSLPNLEIQVKDMRVRSNFSAVMWGFMAGSDSIKGDIVLREPDGSEIDRFEVSVSYALGGLAGGQDEARMGWLYEKFAEETMRELTGKKVEE
ncbi:MAG: DUF4410 domain-containing protein [Gammaproteobacteria bacterium]|nr:DUF4410 domain-containing protein [Gammaproteobacteria bacterium]